MNITKKELVELVKSNNEFKINSMGRMKKNEILEIVETYPYIIIKNKETYKWELVPKSLNQKQIDRERRQKRRINIKMNSPKNNVE